MALERLGVARFGASGTLFAAAVLTSALGSARIPRTGYSGLMLPVLEDSRLAQRASEGLVSVDSLLLYAAVCGPSVSIPCPCPETPTAMNWPRSSWTWPRSPPASTSH